MSQEQFIGGVPVPGNTVALIALGNRDDFIFQPNDPLAQAPIDPATGQPPNDAYKVSKTIIQQALVTHLHSNPPPVPAPAAPHDPSHPPPPANAPPPLTHAPASPAPHHPT